MNQENLNPAKPKLDDHFIMKSNILVTVGGGVVQGVWVSKDILDAIQVIV